ncbi:MAG: biotin--[acetyl-CoA-carboxylase] ligase [Methanothrix sp.]|nr:biotin--[acetyl-CoA-carboxylase] ligase [Methanothrix sp.]
MSSGEWVSGEDMATRQGISRAAVWKQIQSLRTKGYEIESSTRKGYRLAKFHDPLDADMICEGLRTKWLGKDLRCFDEVCSTNDVARSVARECRNGTVILAETQTQGRGRLSRPWASPPGGIWMSLVLKPKISLDRAYRINMAVSVAVSRSMCALYGLDVGIKWPNDLLIGGRKVCGILMEISAEVDRVDWAVVGLGINANIDVMGFSVDWRATSLRQELCQDVSRIDLIQRLLLEIEGTYHRMHSRDLYEEWRRRSVTLGKQVRITSASGDLSGEAIDLAEDGALLIRAEDKIKRVLAGDCIHLRAPGEA